jgi:phage-related protein
VQDKGTPRKKHAEIHWEGDSKDVLSGFPFDVKLTLGYSLRRLQNGELPACDTRSMSSIGSGVWELKTDDERTWYRLLYLTRIGNTLYVLHCFEKDSAKTDKRDINIAKQRLSDVLQRIQDQKKRSKHHGSK